MIAPIVRLISAAEQLNDDERLVLAVLAERLVRAGRANYGPLNIDADKRDMRRETFEEVADGLFYAGVRLVQIEREGGDK